MKNEIFQAILEKLNQNEVTELTLSEEILTTVQIKSLAETLKTNSSLKKLHIMDDHLTDEDIENLAIALKKNKTILKLNLSSNQISDKGATYLADMLKVNKSLRSLSLQNNSIHAEGIKLIADAALHHHAFLTSLNLHDNSGAHDTVELVDRILGERKKQSTFGLLGATRIVNTQPQQNNSREPLSSLMSKKM